MPIQLSDFQSKNDFHFYFDLTLNDESFSLEIGLGLAIFGVAFIFLGMIFLFEKGLLALGNVSPIDKPQFSMN